MNRRDGASGMGNKAAQRGLWRLMLKLPAIRGPLQILAAHSSAFDELFEAYEDASIALARFRGSRDISLIHEYEALCSSIEEDVLAYVLQSRDDVTN